MFAFMTIALLAGAMLPLQAVFNSRLAHAMGSPVWAAFISALVSAVVLFFAALMATGGLPRSANLQVLPAWAWAGGVCGVVTLVGVTVCTPRLGAAAMVALVITRQVIFSMALDRFGLFGLSSHPVTLQRAIAATLLLAGSILLQ